jgi:hypothetical protein
MFEPWRSQSPPISRPPTWIPAAEAPESRNRSSR